MTRLLLGLLAWLLLAGVAGAETEPVLRPGDVLAMALPGEPALTGSFVVNRQGSLDLPEVGPVPVAGSTVAAAQAAVRERLTAVFRDVGRLSLRLLERRLPIRVLGNVLQPGPLDLPENATAQMAIHAAGGPAPGADLERVQLRRGDRVTVFDYRRYLGTGDPALLPALEPLDTLFVPQGSRVVKVMGAVGKPGPFAWARDLSLLEVLAQAGGPLPQADLARVQVLNPAGGAAEPVPFDLAAFLQRGGNLASIPRVGPGATVVVPELSPDRRLVRPDPEGAVYVLGAVGRPGRYGLSPGLGFLDVLAATDGPNTDADLQSVSLTRHGAGGPEVTAVNLRQFFDTGDPTLLPEIRAGDILFVPSRDRSWLEEPKERTVRVLGAVAHPARYRFDDDMTILDLLAQAGGPTSDAYQEKIVVMNLSCCRDQARVFDLVKFARTGDFTMLPVVRPGDTVYVPFLSQTNWSIFMSGVRDVFQIVSTLAVLSTLGAF